MFESQINTERLQKAIVIWQECLNCYKNNMIQIKKDHKLTWWFRPSYWANEKAFSKSFQALIKRRIQLQTAIKQQGENK